MGAVAEGRVLALSAGAKSEGLTGFRIDFVGRGLPAHGLIIEQSLKNESSNCGEVESGWWKAGVWVLAILLIPIEKDAGGGVEIELVALLQSAPAVLVSLGIKGYLSFRGMGDVVKENEMSRFVELLRTNAVLNNGKIDILYRKARFL